MLELLLAYCPITVAWTLAMSVVNKFWKPSRLGRTKARLDAAGSSALAMQRSADQVRSMGWWKVAR